MYKPLSNNISKFNKKKKSILNRNKSKKLKITHYKVKINFYKIRSMKIKE